jgi:EAL domain-containing protein (putative c-di-GMP-specific phosphodiesterase class I)
VTLVRNVSSALEEARAAGSNRYQFCSHAMNSAAARKQQLRKRLGAALERGHIELQFQPVRDLRTSRIEAAEVLLRWTDPELGPVSPAEFIPVAEETGFIISLGAWVLESACAQIRDWLDRGFVPPRVAVNVSAHQLSDAGLVDVIRGALTNSRLSPAQLDIEITETVMIRPDQKTTSSIVRVHELGVGVVLDDFGTGFSSLSYLSKYPIDRLKIDGSFVSQMPESEESGSGPVGPQMLAAYTLSSDRSGQGEGMAVAMAVLAMAQSLGLPVVAEGVETLEQAEILRAHGCEEAQGYLISRAVPAKEFERFLERAKPDES